MTIHSIDTIVSDTQVRGGQPIIAGTRLRVVDLVASHIFRGLTPDELAVNYALDLGQVYAALAYYYQHKTAMDDQRRADVVRAEQLLADAVAEGMEAADITWLDEPEASSHSRQHVERHVLNTWQRTQRSAKK